MTSARRLAPAIAWAALIFVITSIPNPPIPKALERSDKLVHGLIYCVLGILARHALTPAERGQWRRVALVALVCLTMAAADELHQLWIPGRFADVLDWTADAVGILIGVTIAALPRLTRGNPSKA